MATKSIVATSTSTVNTSSSASTNDCAWCNKEQGKSQGEGSHGICTPHSAQVVAQAKERRAARGGR